MPHLLVCFILLFSGYTALGCPFNITGFEYVTDQADVEPTKSSVFPDGWGLVRLVAEPEWGEAAVEVTDVYENMTFAFNLTSEMFLVMPISVPTPDGWPYKYQCEDDTHPDTFWYTGVSEITNRDGLYDAFNWLVNTVVPTACQWRRQNLLFDLCMDETNNNVIACQPVCMPCAVCYSNDKGNVAVPQPPAVFPCPSTCQAACVWSTNSRAMCDSCLTAYPSTSCACSSCAGAVSRYLPGACPFGDQNRCKSLASYTYLDQGWLRSTKSEFGCASCVRPWELQSDGRALCPEGRCLTLLDVPQTPGVGALVPGCQSDFWIDGCPNGDNAVNPCGRWTQSTYMCYGLPLFTKTGGVGSAGAASRLYAFPGAPGSVVGAWAVSRRCDPTFADFEMRGSNPGIINIGAPQTWAGTFPATTLSLSAYCIGSPATVDPQCRTFTLDCTIQFNTFCGQHFVSGTGLVNPVCNGGAIYRSTTSTNVQVRKLASGAWAVVSATGVYATGASAGRTNFLPSCADSLFTFMTGPASGALGGTHQWTTVGTGAVLHPVTVTCNPMSPPPLPPPPPPLPPLPPPPKPPPRPPPQPPSPPTPPPRMPRPPPRPPLPPAPPPTIPQSITLTGCVTAAVCGTYVKSSSETCYDPPTPVFRSTTDAQLALRMRSTVTWNQGQIINVAPPSSWVVVRQDAPAVCISLPLSLMYIEIRDAPCGAWQWSQATTGTTTWTTSSVTGSCSYPPGIIAPTYSPPPSPFPPAPPAPPTQADVCAAIQVSGCNTEDAYMCRIYTRNQRFCNGKPQFSVGTTLKLTAVEDGYWQIVSDNNPTDSECNGAGTFSWKKYVKTEAAADLQLNMAQAWSVQGGTSSPTAYLTLTCSTWLPSPPPPPPAPTQPNSPPPRPPPPPSPAPPLPRPPPPPSPAPPMPPPLPRPSPSSALPPPTPKPPPSPLPHPPPPPPLSPFAPRSSPSSPLQPPQPSQPPSPTPEQFRGLQVSNVVVLVLSSSTFALAAIGTGVGITLCVKRAKRRRRHKLPQFGKLAL